MFNVQFFKARLLKKNLLLTLIVWVLSEGIKKAKKRVKNCRTFLSYVLNKYQNVTHFSTSIFQGLFKNIVLDL